MKKSDRIVVYLVGFVLGTLLVSMILTRRAVKEERAEDRWAGQDAAVAQGTHEPLPADVPEPIRKGRLLDFGFLPDEAAAEQKVWLLSFDDSYPYVRVVEDLQSGEIAIMAADQILIHLAEGVDVTELKPMLDTLELRMRMFNRSDRIAVVGVVSMAIDAVPATVAAVEPYAHLFESAGPDRILFKKSPD